ncbi:MAG: chemotaxis protein [Hyphomicrobiales bacterium]|nr:chemotaxis protein [Hyphomicrobiales bacterium]
MSGLPIRLRLTIVVLLSLLPVVLLGYLFFAQSDKDIAFASKENLGVAYLRTVVPDLSSVVLLKAGGTLPGNPALASASQTYDGDMASATQAQAYAAARQALASGSGKAPTARDAAGALVGKVGDSSNLILDPDLDSYYAMDLMLLKLPSAVTAAAALLDEINAAKSAASLSDADRVSMVADVGAFEALIAGAEASYTASAGASTDGSVAAELKQSLTAYMADAATFGDALSAAITGLSTEATRGATDLSAAATTHVNFQNTALSFWQKTATTLERLLNKRINGFQSKLWSMLGLAGALVLVVVATSWLMSRSIVRAIRRLENSILQVAEGHANDEIAGIKGRDELAAVARAVAHLREQTIARLEAADAVKESERSNAAEAGRIASVERLRNEQNLAGLAAEQQKIVKSLLAGLEALASGDLGVRIEAQFSGEFQRVRDAFNQTVETFSNIISQVHGASGRLKNATDEMLAGANDLSDRTLKQSSTIEQTSAAMSQLAATVRGNSERAQRASQLAQSTCGTAIEGGDVAVEANQAMQRIREASEKISSVIGVIDDIAFQTNLLALNASVEAARAGEVGKGFAVVAVEVRRLAQSAANASAEVKTMVNQSAIEVGAGAKLVAEVAQKLNLILDSAKESSALISDIAVASQEQALSLEQVNTAVTQIDDMTQHNVALVEETNAAIGQTQAEAADLDRVVEVFDLHKASALRAA